jgi:hypothetical protein
LIHLFHQPVCQDDVCDRHRALAGGFQTNLVKCLISSAITLVLGGGAADFFGWEFFQKQPTVNAASDSEVDGVPGVMKPHKARKAMTVFVSPPIASLQRGTAPDAIQKTYPHEHETARVFANWRVDIYTSGRVAITGDEQAMEREFWESQAFGELCFEARVGSGWYMWIGPPSKMHADGDAATGMWFLASRDYIIVTTSGAVDVEGTAPPDVVAFFRRMAAVLHRQTAQCERS